MCPAALNVLFVTPGGSEQEELFKAPPYEWEVKSKPGRMVPGDSPPHYRQEFEEEVETEPEHPARPLSLSKPEGGAPFTGKTSPPSYFATEPPRGGAEPPRGGAELTRGGADMSLSFTETRGREEAEEVSTDVCKCF